MFNQLVMNDLFAFLFVLNLLLKLFFMSTCVSALGKSLEVSLDKRVYVYEFFAKAVANGSHLCKKQGPK